jgi:hypothetical protein
VFSLEAVGVVDEHAARSLVPPFRAERRMRRGTIDAAAAKPMSNDMPARYGVCGMNSGPG